VSRLLIISRPSLAIGFQLAGVDTYSAEDVESAQEVISTLLENDETGLLAIDDGLIAQMDARLLEQLNNTKRLQYIVFPGGGSQGYLASRQQRMAEMIRRAIGFHILFQAEGTESNL
jgi:vacuolar-type H+-ATPase subunit F/Vma7